MGLFVGAKQSNPVPEGLHAAVCYSLVDLGTQYNETFKKSSRKVRLTWEIPAERINLERDGETVSLPRAIGKTYTFSLHAKSGLHADLRSWRGKAFTPEEQKKFDLRTVVGRGCSLNIIHAEKDGQTYANISAIVPPLGQSPKPENPLCVFDLDEFLKGESDQLPKAIPPWLQDIVKLSDEWRAKFQPVKQEHPDLPADDDNEIPF